MGYGWFNFKIQTLMPYTGRRIVTRLKEVNSVTGEDQNITMANVAPGPPYIAPYTDTEQCPVVYNTVCPTKIYATRSGTTLEFEFSLPNSVVFNKDLDLLKVIASQNGSNPKSMTFSLGGKNFFHGTLSALDASKAYQLDVVYYKGSTLKQTCHFQTNY